MHLQGEIIDYKLIDLDTDFIKRSKQPNPEPWGTSQPHNAYDETPLPARVAVGVKNRYDGGFILKDTVFHQSWAASPTRLARWVHLSAVRRVRLFGMTGTRT